ncbi:adhesion G-protein coupled receptor G1-like [Eucyclogobius newberryi]|uniref:adhesion G-protein coupled receptor G1-like n=1 Tax=Eucyclogobius newberryi TaxID=166745 RepID=UPI003B59AB47
MNVTSDSMKTHSPQCVFLNDSTQTLDTDGCLTLWEPGQSHVVCSCDHLTFFAVLMISNKETTQVSPEDQENLTYITFIGCSISFCALVVAVVLFITNRNIRADVSMTIHVNLAIALLLLNLHFLPNTAMGIWSFSWPSPWFCFYLAIALHFSLLTSFCWMAVEGFHLYLLLVKVFNIYVKHYLLKVSIVGWGVPVVVVSIVAIVNRDVYGSVSMDQTNSTSICFIRDDVVKVVTVMGLFGLVFLFNLSLLTVTVRNMLRMRKSKSNQVRTNILTFF